MIKIRKNNDAEYQYFDWYRGFISHRGQLDIGYVLHLYWIRIEIVKFWEL